MGNSRLISLVGVTIIVIIAAIVASEKKAPTTNIEKINLYPELGGEINSINHISIEGNGRSLSLEKVDDNWVIADKGNHPALFEKIRETIISVSELKVLAEKTNSPELYDRLGVEDHDQADSQSYLLTLRSNENTKVSLIVGNRRRSKAADDRPGLYVRQQGNSQSLLVEGNLDISSETAQWIERDLFSIDAERLQSISISAEEEPEFRLSRQKPEDNLIPEIIPEGKQSQSDVILTSMGSILEDIYINNVAPVNTIQFAENFSSITVTCFDGLVAEIKSNQHEDLYYASFTFRYEQPQIEDDVKQTVEEENNSEPIDVAREVDDLNAIVAGWVYEIPEYKYKLFSKKPQELLRDPIADDNTSDE